MAEDAVIRIGVLSHRGYEATLKMWTPTADYLSHAVSGQRFEITPLDFDEVSPAVRFGQIDFLLVNPGIYVNMEVRYRISRIATLNNLTGKVPHNVFGGVIFTHNGRNDINYLEDLAGKNFMAVDETSLGGFQMAWRELKTVGIDPYHDFNSLAFGGIHDRVVMAVRDGRVDAGTVRTDILERMAASGTVDLDQFKVINAKSNPEFLFYHSTRLYPEWPFSKLQHTSNELAQQIAVALLNMPEDHPAAAAGKYAGWTIPLDYQQVHELFTELKLPPYQRLAPFTLADAMKRYWYWLLTVMVFLLLMAVMTTWVARLNRQLKRSKLHLEQQHDLILNSVADGIYGVDLDGNSTFVNQAAEVITGWKARDLIGANQHELLHHTRADGTSHPSSECPVYHTFRDNETRYIDDDLFWRKDGSSLPVEYSCTPLRDERGATFGSVVVFRDISQRKHAEEDARQHQMELAHVARLSTMGEMASGMAHELNQPLTAIATNAHACIRMLESGDEHREKLEDAMERIGTQAERAGEIIRQMRRFVRKDQPQCTLIDINGLIEEVLLLIKPEARRAGVRIHKVFDRHIPHLWARHIQIDQVIMNLARNAIEAMLDTEEEGRELTIGTRTGESNTVTVSIEDTGPGIDPQIRDRLFTPFTTTKPKGMGLGLSISLGIIEAHQGNLYLDSAPGQGAIFRFTLPIGKEEKL